MSNYFGIVTKNSIAPAPTVGVSDGRSSAPTGWLSSSEFRPTSSFPSSDTLVVNDSSVTGILTPSDQEGRSNLVTPPTSNDGSTDNGSEESIASSGVAVSSTSGGNINNNDKQMMMTTTKSTKKPMTIPKQLPMLENSVSTYAAAASHSPRHGAIPPQMRPSGQGPPKLLNADLSSSLSVSSTLAQSNEGWYPTSTNDDSQGYRRFDALLQAVNLTWKWEGFDRHHVTPQPPIVAKRFRVC